MKNCSAAPEEDKWHGNHANKFDRFVSKEIQERPLDRVDTDGRRSPVRFRCLDELDFKNVGDLFGQKHVRRRRVAVRLRAVAVRSLLGSPASVADLKSTFKVRMRTLNTVVSLKKTN